MQATIEVKVLERCLPQLGAKGSTTGGDAVGVPGVVSSEKEGLFWDVLVLKV
jgi:hypothetical protein